MEALLKLYYDHPCARELPKVNGSYELSVSLLATKTYTNGRVIYVKNVGTHKAYNITAETTSENVTIGSVGVLDAELGIGQVSSISVNIPVVEGEDVYGTVNINLIYDNLK